METCHTMCQQPQINTRNTPKKSQLHKNGIFIRIDHDPFGLFSPSGYRFLNLSTTSGSTNFVPSSWLPSVILQNINESTARHRSRPDQFGCKLCGRPNSSSFRVPGDSLSMMP